MSCEYFQPRFLWGFLRAMPLCHFPSHEEADKLLATLAEMREPKLYDMALLSLHTGMRAGEIFNLKNNDLDFQNDLIKITDPKNKSIRLTPDHKRLAVKNLAAGLKRKPKIGNVVEAKK